MTMNVDGELHTPTHILIPFLFKFNVGWNLGQPQSDKN